MYANTFAILLIFCFVFGCAQQITLSKSTSNILDNKACKIQDGEFTISGAAVEDRIEQTIFFKGNAPRKILPVFVCVHNGTSKNYGIDEDEFFINDSKKVSNVEFVNKTNGTELKEDDSFASTVGMLGGSVAFGIIPGLVIGAVASQNAGNPTDIAIEMQNRKFKSGVIRPNETVQGFIYFKKSDPETSVNYDGLFLLGKGTDLENKSRVVFETEFLNAIN